MSQKRKYEKIELPPELYKYKGSVEQLEDETRQITPVVKLKWDRGIFLYLENAEYPMKGFVSPETMWALNLSKRVLIEAIRFLSKPFFYPAYAIMAILPWKKKVQIIDHFCHSYYQVCWKNLSPFFLKSEYMTPIAQEVEWLVFSFLKNIGVNHQDCQNVSEIVSSLIEYDTAYRYRLQDIFSETTKVQLTQNPRKEVLRLLEILRQRDGKYVYGKFKYAAYALRFLLLFKNVRKAFVSAIEEIDVRRMGYDEIDRYWVCLRKHDYLYMGKSDEERAEMIKDKKKPTLITKKIS